MNRNTVTATSVAPGIYARKALLLRCEALEICNAANTLEITGMGGCGTRSERFCKSLYILICDGRLSAAEKRSFMSPKAGDTDAAHPTQLLVLRERAVFLRKYHRRGNKAEVSFDIAQSSGHPLRFLCD